MERFVAIDNVCAWPNLTLLADGTIAAVIYNQPNHGYSEGSVECWLSDDGGYLWKKKGVAGPHKPDENLLQFAAGLSKDGNLLVLSDGHTPILEVGHSDKFTPVLVSRSRDQGSTWTFEGCVDKVAGAEFLHPYGDIVQSDDGLLGVSVYTMFKGAGDGRNAFLSYFVRSYDNGMTWTEALPLGPKANETAVLSLGGKRLLAAARTNVEGEEHLEIYRSDDFGLTWISKGMVTMPAQIPAHLLLLQDGSVLLTYGIRNKGLQGLGARISRNGGESWGRPVLLLNLGIKGDGGYPSNVQLSDGTIVTAYYSSGVPEHNRYHMGVLRWKLDEFYESL